MLSPIVRGREPEDVAVLWTEMRRAAAERRSSRNRFCALSAVDLALWDLRARLYDVPLVSLLPGVRDRVPVYGSGGFCSYSDDRLREQLAGWVAAGIPRVKMKLGRDPERDPHRLDVAREAIGDAELYVDANGAFSAKEGLRWARRYEEGWDVRWFEEPVSSADFAGTESGRRNSKLTMRLGIWAEADGSGEHSDSSTGYLTQWRHEIPDASWIRKDRWNALAPSRGRVSHRSAAISPPSCARPAMIKRRRRTRCVNTAPMVSASAAARPEGRHRRAVPAPAGLSRSCTGPPTLSGEDVLPGFVLDLEGDPL